jgi:hypothetical protein
MFRLRIFIGADGMKCAPIPFTVPKAPQVAVGVSLSDLVFAKSLGKGQPRMHETKTMAVTSNPGLWFTPDFIASRPNAFV